MNVCEVGQGERKKTFVCQYMMQQREAALSLPGHWLQHHCGTNMQQDTDALKHITDLTHCLKQTHAHGKEDTHTPCMQSLLDVVTFTSQTPGTCGQHELCLFVRL